MRLADHPLTVVLDFSTDLILYEELPSLLASHEPSKQAVVRAMRSHRAGEALTLPVDLTGEVAGAEPPFPFGPVDPARRAELDEAASGVDVEVVALRRTGTAPVSVDAEFLVGGRPVALRAEVYDMAGSALLQVQGSPDFLALSDIERYAIQRLLSPAP